MGEEKKTEEEETDGSLAQTASATRQRCALYETTWTGVTLS